MQSLGQHEEDCGSRRPEELRREHAIRSARTPQNANEGAGQRGQQECRESDEEGRHRRLG